MPSPSDKVIFLQGNRLYLRPPSKEDIPLLVRWINDPEVNQYLAAYLPMTEADEIQWLERLRERKSEEFVLVIVDKSNDKAIGLMGLTGIDWKDRRATTSAVIGEKKYWGNGYGGEAKMLLLNYVFNKMNLRKITSHVVSFNKRSWAYSLKCGYKTEGIMEEHVFKDGKYWDVMVMTIFQKDWPPIWRKFQKKEKRK